MRLLIADKLHPRAVEELRSLPVDVIYEPELTKESLETKLNGFGILVVRSKEVTRKAIEAARSLNLIVRVCAEVSTIDVEAARANELGIGYAPTLEELAAKSDILTVHLALTERTRGIVSRRVFDVLPKRAMFINCARPDLVDYEAMLDAVKNRGLRAAIDVVPNEPRGKKEIAPELFNLTQASATSGFLYATPHIAASTDQAQLAIATEPVR